MDIGRKNRAGEYEVIVEKKDPMPCEMSEGLKLR